MVQRMPPFTYAGAERADFFATAFSPNADDESGKYRLIEKSDAFDLEEAKAVTDGFRSLCLRTWTRRRCSSTWTRR